jgi:geranylgeranyl reductase family protein
MKGSFDVAVVGAGPAGSIAALSLARAGASVAILEKQHFPRDKVCGDVLMPDAIGLLRELGLWEDVRTSGHSMEFARFFAPNGSHVDLAGSFHTIRRIDLDALLVKKAVEAGATLISGAAVTDFRATSSTANLGYVKDGNREEMQVRLALLACGAHAKTLKMFGVSLRETPSALAMRTYYRLRENVDDTRLFFWYERAVLPGYGWIFPLGDGVFNIGVGIFRDAGPTGQNLQHVLNSFLTQCEAPREMIRGGTQLAPFKGAPLRTGLTGAKPSADRLLVCGESIGATYSMSGEGIGKAMETANVAAEHALDALSSGRMTAHDLARYDQNLERRFRERFAGYRTGQYWLGHPAVCNFVFGRARKRPRLKNSLEGIIAERQNPTELLSVYGLLKALVLR